MYPLKFEPIYKQMIWGGDRLATLLNRTLPTGNVGESWDISCRKNEMSIISNGMYKGKQILEIIYGNQNYLGTKISKKEDFPLLVKVIDANDNLSVQVHPKDEYAQKEENYPFGKTEMWYILDAPKDSFLILGVKNGVSKEVFSKSIKNNTVEENLNKLYIKKGDVINIPAGVIHVITKGVAIVEIQQNSDITYRVFDYNRIGLDGEKRELHINKALDVIDFDYHKKNECVKGITINKDNNKITYYISNKYFCVLKYEVKDFIKEVSNEERFYIFTCVEGECRIYGHGFEESINIGESIFIPAGLGEYTIKGDGVLLKSFVPDTNKDFIEPLIKEGFDMDYIKKFTCI